MLKAHIREVGSTNRPFVLARKPPIVVEIIYELRENGEFLLPLSSLRSHEKFEPVVDIHRFLASCWD